MNLYTIDSKFKPYINSVQAVFPEDINPYSGIPYREDEDFIEAIGKLNFRLELDHNDKKIPGILY